MSIPPDATTPRIRPHPSVDGVQLVDPIEDAQFTLLTPDPVTTAPCGTDRFYFPVDAAATVRADRIETPYLVDVWIRDADGTLVAEGIDDGGTTAPPGRYVVELSTTRMKCYLALEGAIEVTADDERVAVALSGTDRLHVGARSFHEHPAATVTTTDRPRDVMRAVTALGSALKTTTCERSFPTLRGHPPLIERGDELEIPEGVDPPETDVAIEVPPDLSYVYAVASLAYYLGATVRPGSTPRLIAGDATLPLDGDGGFETTVERVLKHVFILDCVTRTEGYYEVDLHERRLVEERVDLDFAALYDRSIAEQVATYLDVPFESVREARPRWKLTADVVPDPEHVSTLPFLANELAAVRCPTRRDVKRHTVDDLADQVEAFFRGRPDALARGSTDATRQVRGGLGSEADAEPTTVDGTVFRPPATDSIEQAYVGEGIPLGASKMSVDAYYRRLDYEPSSDPQIRVAVVCNDPEMAEENVVSDLYGARDWIDFDISLDDGLTTAEMRDLLASDVDFLHFVGHVTDRGIQCADGHLDAASLDSVGVDAFLLNACNSYEQGRALVEGGALAGIATVADVLDERATSVGRTVARLLNQGFSLASVISLIEEHEEIGEHYLVIGDGSASLVVNESGTPHTVEIQDLDSDSYEVKIHGYPSLRMSLGTMFNPYINGNSRRYLNSGRMCSLKVEKTDLAEFLLKQNMPVIYNSELGWSSNFQLE